MAATTLAGASVLVAGAGLSDLAATRFVVEHEMDVIRHADWVVDVGFQPAVLLSDGPLSAPGFISTMPSLPIVPTSVASPFFIVFTSESPSAPAATTDVDVVLVGLPGSGKSAVGRRLAQRHGATFVDLDEAIEQDAGRTVPEIFAEQGEAAFRVRERAAVAALGEPDRGRELRRVIAPGGGAVVSSVSGSGRSRKRFLSSWL